MKHISTYKKLKRRLYWKVHDMVSVALMPLFFYLDNRKYDRKYNKWICGLCEFIWVLGSGNSFKFSFKVANIYWGLFKKDANKTRGSGS